MGKLLRNTGKIFIRTGGSILKTQSYLLTFRKSFTFRIFRTTSLAILISLAVLTFLTGFQLSEREINQHIYSGTQTLDQTTSFIEYQIRSIEGIVNVISYDDTIQSVLSNSDDYYNKNVSSWNIHTTSCREILYNSYTTDNIDELRLYSSSGPAAFEETEEFKKLSSALRTEWYSRLHNTGKSTLWLPGSFFDSKEAASSDHILYVKKISDLSHINKYLGYVTASVPKETFSTIIRQGELTRDTLISVFNTSNEMVASNNQMFDSPSDLQELISSASVHSDTDLKKVRYNGQSYLMGVRNIENSDWTLAMMVPYSDILSTINSFRMQMILSGFLVILICLPIIYKLAVSLNSRIIILKNLMSESSSGNFSAVPIDNGDDEIGDLTNSFYHMQQKIAKLIADQYQLGYEIKSLEFQVLQSQINPHFLYNTLDMIYWMGLKYHCIAVSEAARRLGEFYMLSLGHGEKLVTIQDELRHVQTYVDIQNMRFENRISLVSNVPCELLPYYTLKIILQPIVENSITHGILERSDETGSIVITGDKTDSCIRLIISDNGVGIPEEKLKNLLLKKSSEKHHGYGIWNIHERLRLSYGSAYGLHYESTVGVGTTVTVTLPLIQSCDAPKCSL